MLDSRKKNFPESNSLPFALSLTSIYCKKPFVFVQLALFLLLLGCEGQSVRLGSDIDFKSALTRTYDIQDLGNDEIIVIVYKTEVKSIDGIPRRGDKIDAFQFKKSRAMVIKNEWFY